MASLNFALWNCAGILRTGSADEKFKFLMNSVQNFDILVLIETHHASINDIQPLFHGYTGSYELLHSEKVEGDPYAGVVILINKQLSLTHQTVVLPGRIMNFGIKQGGDTYSISAVYGYTGSKATQANMRQMTELLSQHHDISKLNIIFGDFNFVDNDLDRTSSSRLGMNASDKSIYPIWKEFIDTIDILDPFRARNPKKRMFSYIHSQGNAKSRLDRIYINDERCNSILHYKHTPTRFVKAHRILTFTVQGPGTRGPSFWKMNTRVISDHAYELLVEKVIADVRSLGILDPIEQWMIFIETIRIETQVYCSKKKFFERQVRSMCEKNIETLEQNPRLSTCPSLQEEYAYFLERLKHWQIQQVEGHMVRIKTQPRLEHGEPNISFFASLERKSALKKCIQQLKGDKGATVTDTDDIIRVVTDFYAKLFDRKHTDSQTTDKLLRNINRKISDGDRISLDRPITKEELEFAVMKLQGGKSPGPDGIPAEFYQTYWPHIRDMYLDFVNSVRINSFPDEKNTSITTIIYKKKGDPYLLINYRPIALMNVDVKILTKLLSMRLATVLPSIIHESQSAVLGRTIGNTIHLVRDIIDMANQSNEGAALLFLDQEKAFDRVNHTFLRKVLRGFGFGNAFIDWIGILYSNAATRIDVNGFFTDRISLRSGVRQGCPLSPLLYVLIIEILALQLRANPNIVGFLVEGEKIVSSHYADDTVIKITQNRCFKEVYKELIDYEKASGARINYDKSKGLWLGKWRHRTDDPFDGLYTNPTKRIRWTSGNVKYLGIYVGNENPGLQTFSEIIPKMIKKLNFWKPLSLPVLAKARVIEIYIASKLWYAANFYPIPPDMVKDIDIAFLGYIKFPRAQHNVSRVEMEKLREKGGIKLINTQLKSETPKAHWLIRLITDDNLFLHRSVFNSLVGTQKGNLTGTDLIFADGAYVRAHVVLPSSFYKEALEAISKLDLWKHYPDLDQEHLFFNKIFLCAGHDEIHESLLKPFHGNQVLTSIHTYGDLQAAERAPLAPKLLAVIKRKKESITYIRDSTDDNLIKIHFDGKDYEFISVTQKLIYSELIYLQSRDHFSETKWCLERFHSWFPAWDKVWESVHNQFFTEEVKSTVWDQIHLNFYTTYSYNKWHNELHPCPLCRKIPDDIFHIILDCKFVKVMWKRIERTIMKILPVPPTDIEMAFGVQPRSKEDRYATILRNWITFSMRHLVMLEERKAYYRNGTSPQAVPRFFARFNRHAREELALKKLQFDHRRLPTQFEKIVTSGGVVAQKVENQFRYHDIM